MSIGLPGRSIGDPPRLDPIGLGRFRCSLLVIFGPWVRDGRGAQARDIVRGKQCRMPGTRSAFFRGHAVLASNGRTV